VRKTLLSTLAIAILLGSRGVCPAQVSPATGRKPLVTISFSGYDELRADVEFVGNLGNNPQLAKRLEAMLKAMTQGPAAGPGPALPGLDTKRPWGAVVQTDGQQFPIYGFIPVTDLKQLMGVVGNFLPGGPPAPPADGVYELGLNGPAVFVQQKGGWAFITSNRQDLATVPADPQKVLGGLNQKYDLAVRASVQNVPVPLRQMILDQIKMGAEIGMQQLPGESNEDYALRQGVARRMIEQFTATVDELDEVLIGWAIDRQTGTSYVDFQITAVAGTKTAAQFSQAATATTNFAGFELPGAALTGNWAGTFSDSDVAQAKDAIANVRVTALRELKNQGLSPDELKLATQLLSDLLEVLEKTVENKTADGGLALLLKPGGLTLVAGGTIADGAKLESALKQLAAEVQKAEPQFSQLLKLDAETYQGVRFHTLAIPTDQMDDQVAAKLFGQNLDVVLGISPTSVYLAAGRDALSTLKQVIDGSKSQAGKQIPPARLSLAAAPIAKFVAGVAEDEQARQVAAQIGDLLEKSSGKDHLILTSKPIPNGATVRLEVEGGILKLLGSLGEMMGGMAAPGGPGLQGKAAPEDADPF
jgi:hypothetical protein